MSDSDSDGEFERFLQEADDSLSPEPSKLKGRLDGAYTSSSASAVTAAAAALLASSKLSKIHKSKRKSKTTSSAKKISTRPSSKTQRSDSEEEPPSYYDDYSMQRGSGLENLDSDPYAFDLTSPAFSITASKNDALNETFEAKKKEKTEKLKMLAIKAVNKSAPMSMDDRVAEILKRTGSSQIQESEKSDEDESSEKNSDAAASTQNVSDSSHLQQVMQGDDRDGDEGGGSDLNRSSSSDSLGVVSADFSVHLPPKPSLQPSRLSLSSLDSEQFVVNRDALNSDLAEATPSRYEQQEMTFSESEVDKVSISKKDEARESQLYLSESDTFGYGDEDFEDSERSGQEGGLTHTESQVGSTAQENVKATQDLEYSDDYHDDEDSSARDDAQAARDVVHSDDDKSVAHSSNPDAAQATQNVSCSDDYQDDAFEAEIEVKVEALTTALPEPHEAVKKDVQDTVSSVVIDPIVDTNSKIDALLASYGIFDTQLQGEEAGAKKLLHDLESGTQDPTEHPSKSLSLDENVSVRHAIPVTAAKESTGVVNSFPSSPPPPPPPADDDVEDNHNLQHFVLDAPTIDSEYLAQPPVKHPTTSLKKTLQPVSAADKFLQIESQVAALRFNSPSTPSLAVATSPSSNRVHPVASNVVVGLRDDAGLVGPPPPILEPMSFAFEENFVTEDEDTQREIDEFVRTSVIVRQETQEAAQRVNTARENALVLRLQQAQRQVLQLKEYIQTTAPNGKLTASKGIDTDGKLHNSTRSSQAALENLQKEMKTQDTLIAAFQKENERLMQQLKQVRQDAHYNVHEANEELRRHVKTLQEQLREVATLGGGSDLTSKAQYRAAVEARLEAEAHVLALQEELAGLRLSHQQKLNELTLELDRVKKAKIELECRYEGVDLTQVATEAQQVCELQKELELVKKERAHALAELQKKLDWYVENQRLLDDQDEELRQLRRQVAAQSSGPTTLTDTKAQKASPAQSHSRSPMDIRRIQELESRLAEVEEAMRRRHPDSLANLILATRRANEESKTRALEREYQDKIAALSCELEQVQEGNETKLKSFRQQQEKLLLQYKRKVKEQEKQLKQLSKAPLSHKLTPKDTTGASPSSNADLAKVRRFYTDKIKELERKWEAKFRSLRKQQYSGLKSNQQVQGLTYVDSAVAIANLQRQIRLQELELKQERAKVEQLEAESQLGIPPVNDTIATEDTKSKQKLEDQIASLKAQLENSENTRARLAHTLTSVQTLSLARTLNSEPEKVSTKSSPKPELVKLEQTGAEVAQLRQDLDAAQEARNSERATAIQDIDRLEKRLAEYTEKSAALEAQLAGTQTEAQSLQKLLLEAEQHNESLKTQAQRIPDFEEEILALRKEMEVPRTPSMVQYRSLELKVATLEQKYKLRETELKVVLDRALTSTHLEQLSRERAHRAAIAAKNAEIASFKLQLEEILDELAQLQQPTFKQ